MLHRSIVLTLSVLPMVVFAHDYTLRIYNHGLRPLMPSTHVLDDIKIVQSPGRIQSKQAGLMTFSYPDQYAGHNSLQLQIVGRPHHFINMRWQAHRLIFQTSKHCLRAYPTSIDLDHNRTHSVHVVNRCGLP